MGFGTEFVAPITMHRGRNIRSRYEENHPDFTPPSVSSSSVQVPMFASELPYERRSRYDESSPDFSPPMSTSRGEAPVSAVVHERGRKVGGSGRPLAEMTEDQLKDFLATLPQVGATSNVDKTNQARKAYAERKVSDIERKRSARAARIEQNRQQGVGFQGGCSSAQRSTGSGTLVLEEYPIEIPRDQYRDPPAVELPKPLAPQEVRTGYDTVGAPQIQFSESPQYTTVRDKPFERFKPLSPPQEDSLGREFSARAEQIQQSTLTDLEYHRELSQMRDQYDRKIAEYDKRFADLELNHQREITRLSDMVRLNSQTNLQLIEDLAGIAGKIGGHDAEIRHIKQRREDDIADQAQTLEGLQTQVTGLDSAQKAIQARYVKQKQKRKALQAEVAAQKKNVEIQQQDLLAQITETHKAAAATRDWVLDVSKDRQATAEELEAFQAQYAEDKEQYAADKKAAAEREQAALVAKKQRQKRQAEKARQVQAEKAAKEQRQAEETKQMQAALAEIQSQVAESKQGLLQSVGDLQKKVESNRDWLSNLSANRRNNTESIEAMRAEHAADKKAAAEREQAAIAAKKQRQAEKARQVQAEKAAQSKAITNLQTQLDAVKRTRNEDVKVFNKNHEEHWADRGVLTTRIQALEEEIERKNIEMQKYASELEEYKARLVSMELVKPSVDMGGIRSQLASLEGSLEDRFGNVRRALDQVNSHLSNVEIFYAPPGGSTHPFDPRKDPVGRSASRSSLIQKIRYFK